MNGSGESVTATLVDTYCTAFNSQISRISMISLTPAFISLMMTSSQLESRRPSAIQFPLGSNTSSTTPGRPYSGLPGLLSM